VSRWHAPPKSRGISRYCSPLSPLGCERKRKRKDEKRRPRALPKTEMKRASGEEQCVVDDGCQDHRRRHSRSRSRSCRRRRGYARFLAWLRRQNKNRVKIKAVASRGETRERERGGRERERERERKRKLKIDKIKEVSIYLRMKKIKRERITRYNLRAGFLLQMDKCDNRELCRITAVVKVVYFTLFTTLSGIIIFLLEINLTECYVAF